MCFSNRQGVLDLRKQVHLGGRLEAGLHLEVTQVVDMRRLILRAAAVLKSPCPPLRDPAEWVQRRHCLTATSAPVASQWSPINNPPTYSSVSLSLFCLSIALSPSSQAYSVQIYSAFFFSSMPLFLLTLGRISFLFRVFSPLIFRLVFFASYPLLPPPDTPLPRPKPLPLTLLPLLWY